MSDGKEECEKLMNEALPLAEKMLRKQKEFFPYAYVLRPAGDYAIFSPRGDSENPTPQELIDILRFNLAKEIKGATASATAIVYNVRVPLSQTVKSDAIAVALDHRNGFSAVICLPYSFGWRKLKFGTAVRHENHHPLFDSSPVLRH